MQSPRPLLALALLTIPLAGCAGLPFGASEEATAAELAPAALAAAKAWRADAVLVAASAVEAVNRSDYEGFPRTGDLFLDPAPGNGRAPFWVYLFLSSRDGAAGVFTVPARTRTAVEIETHEPPTPNGHGTTPPGASDAAKIDLAKLLDSDDAMQKARGDARFARALAALAKPAFLLHLEVEDDDTDAAPRWNLFATGADGDAAFAVVNAESGVVEQAGPANASEVPGVGYKPRHTVLHESRHDGTLTLADPKKTYALPVSEPEAGLRVVLCAGGTVPAGTVRVSVQAPSGEKLAESPPVGQGAGYTLELVLLAKGEYRLEVALVDPSAASDFSLAPTVTSGGLPPEIPPSRC